MHGRASFKLKISQVLSSFRKKKKKQLSIYFCMPVYYHLFPYSAWICQLFYQCLHFLFQLSSKCDNRFFRIRFYIPKMKKYHFLEAVSPPIWCISRNRNTRMSVIPKRSNSSDHLNTSQTRLDEDTLEGLCNSLQETKSSLSSKRLRSGQERTSATIMVDQTFESLDVECNSEIQTTNEVFIFFFSFFFHFPFSSLHYFPSLVLWEVFIVQAKNSKLSKHCSGVNWW